MQNPLCQKCKILPTKSKLNDIEGEEEGKKNHSKLSAAANFTFENQNGFDHPLQVNLICVFFNVSNTISSPAKIY